MTNALQTLDSRGNFNAASAMVPVGQVRLGSLSNYLENAHIWFPDLISEDTLKRLADHTAMLLVAPQDTATISGHGLGTWLEDIARIRSINPSHGIHHDGQFLTGIQINDRPADAPDDPYEKQWARKVTIDILRAFNTNAAVTTGLAMGTLQIFDGHEFGKSDITVKNNVHSSRNNINNALRAQGGKEIITSEGSGTAHWQFTATEYDYPNDHSFVHSLELTADYCFCLNSKDEGLASSRPIALHIPPTP